MGARDQPRSAQICPRPLRLLDGLAGYQPKFSPPAILSALGSELASYPATVVSRHIDEEEEEEDRAPFRLLASSFLAASFLYLHSPVEWWSLLPSFLRCYSWMMRVCRIMVPSPSFLRCHSWMMRVCRHPEFSVGPWASPCAVQDRLGWALMLVKPTALALPSARTYAVVF